MRIDRPARQGWPFVFIPLDGKTDAAKFRLKELIKNYPGTKAAGEAAELLKKLEEG